MEKKVEPKSSKGQNLVKKGQRLGKIRYPEQDSRPVGHPPLGRAKSVRKQVPTKTTAVPSPQGLGHGRRRAAPDNTTTPVPSNPHLPCADNQALNDIAVGMRQLCDPIPHRNFPNVTNPATLTSLERLAWLTPREREVLFLFLDSANYKQVAYKLGRSANTVKNQLASIEHKLSVDSRGALLQNAFALIHSSRSPRQ